MKYLMILFFLSGCAIADKSDRFGGDVDIGIGGLFSYIADLHIKLSVGFSKTCTGVDNAAMDHGTRSGPFDALSGFL